jgi:hypothetical protein
LSVLRTGITAWVTPVAGADGRSTSRRAGSSRSCRDSSTIGAGRVAEKSIVWPLRQVLRRSADVRQEAHVEHAVGLVEHQHLEVVEAGVALAHGRAAGPGWRRSRRTPERSARSCGLAPTPPKTVAERTFACRARSSRLWCTCAASSRVGVRTQGAGAAPARPAGMASPLPVGGGEALQDRQQEGGGLAAAGHRAGEHVAAGEAGRQGGLLDRRRLGEEPEVGDGAQERRMEIEIGKVQGVRTILSLSSETRRRTSDRFSRILVVGRWVIRVPSREVYARWTVGAMSGRRTPPRSDRPPC